MSAEPPIVPPVAPGSVNPENPWPGLRSYDESMHAFFFGRAAEVDELVRLVRRDAVALFYGQSGLGKSSVLQAGLFPKLRAADMLPVHIRLRYTTEFPHPVEQVVREVVTAAHAAGGEAPAPVAGNSLFEYFYDDQHEFWSARNRVLTPVLVFDQFEEIFTLGGRDEASQQRREELLQQLADLAAHRPPAGLVARFEEDPELAARFSTDRTRCRMLFSMREDFLPELGRLRQHLPTLPTGGLRLQRLSGTQAREVLERPGAHLLGEGAAERIIRFVAAEKSGGGGDLAKLDVEPALLSVVASELNFRRQQRGLERISADLVQGARDEILNDFYERALVGLDGRVREFIEEQLLTTTGFRDSVAVEDAEASFGVSRDVIAQLVDRRLLRIDERFQLQRVELTHDLLTAVVKSSRDRRRERQAAEAAQRRAEQDKRTAEGAVALAQAKLRRSRIRAAVTGVMVLLGLGIIVPTILLRRARQARDEATAANELAASRLDQAKQALSRYIIVQANEHLAQANYDAARLVLTLADRGEMEMQLFPPAQLGLLSAALAEPPILQLDGVLKLAPGVRHVTFAPGGRLVIVEAGGTLQVAAVAAGTNGATLDPQPASGALARVAGITSVDLEWMPDCRVAVATESGEVGVFALETGERIGALAIPRFAVEEVTASGTTADAVTSKEVPGEKGESRPVEGATTNSTNNAGKGATGTTGTTASVQRNGHAVCVRFSPDGAQVAAAVSDGRLIVWRRTADDWSAPPTVWSTKKLGAAEQDLTRDETRLNWLLDGTILLSHGAGFVWLAAPGEGWDALDPLEMLKAPGVRQAVVASENQLDGDVFISRGTEAKVSWHRFVASAVPEDHVTQLRISTAVPDRAVAHAVIEQRRLLLTAMRDGSVMVHRFVPAPQEDQEDALQTVQTVTGPKSAQIDLAVRPDGQLVAATSVDGRVFLYRVVQSPFGPEQNVPASRRFVHSSEGWWQLTAQGGMIAPDGTVATDTLDVAAASGLAVAVHSICRRTIAVDSAIAFVSLAEIDSSVSGLPVGVWSFAKKQWLWKKNEQAFGLKRTGEVAGFEDAIQFSPNGSALLVACRTTSMLHVVAAATGDDLIAPFTLPDQQQVRQIAWSGDGQRFAVVTDDLQILVADLDAAAPGKTPWIASVPARSYELSALALDHSGEVVGYITPDNRLVLDFIEQGGELPSLITPLSGPHASALAFTPDSSGIILSTRAGLVARQAPGMAPEQMAKIEWINQRTRQGFRFVPFPSDRPTDLRGLVVTDWRNDTDNFAVAEFQHAWTGLVIDWFSWVDAARKIVTKKPTPALESPGVTRILTQGRSLLKRMDAHRTGRAAVQVFSERAAGAVAEPLALYDYFGVTPLWSQVASYLFDYELTRVSSPQATTLFPAMMERLKSGDSIGDNERAFMKRLVTVLAAGTGNADLINAERAVLRSDGLFTPDEWDLALLPSPDNRLLDLESAAIFDAGDHVRAAPYYAELARRDPANLRYATLEAQNLRFQSKWSEALPLYQKVFERAQALGQIEFAAEAAICVGWCLQGLARHEEADAAMAQGPAIAPDNAWVLRFAASYFIDRGLPDRAAGWTEHMLTLASEPEYQLVRARFLATQYDFEGVRTVLKAAIDSGKASPQVYYEAGELIASLPRKDDKEWSATWLLEAYNKTTDRNLEFRALGALGPIWAQINNYTGALSAYRLRLENYAPDDRGRLEAYGYLLWLRVLTREFDPAREALMQAIALDAMLAGQTVNDRHVLWWKVGLFHEWTGNADAALDAFAKGAELGGASGTWSHITALRRLGRNAEALRVAQNAITQYPDNLDFRLLHAQILLATDPAQARGELTALDDGSTSTIALRAAALRGEAGAAAERYAATLDNPYAEESIELAGLHALAWQQTGDDTQRQRALIAIADALWNRHRGNVALHHEFGLDALRADPLFAVAAQAISEPFESAASLLGLARVDVRIANLLPPGDERTTHEDRARFWLNHAVTKKVLTPAEIRTDAELAAFAPDDPAPEPEAASPETEQDAEEETQESTQ